MRDDCEISFVIPFAEPGPSVPGDLAALLEAFAERDITLHLRALVSARSTRRAGVAMLDDDTEMPYDLFLGVPKHRVPDVVIASGMTRTATSPSTR